MRHRSLIDALSRTPKCCVVALSDHLKDEPRSETLAGTGAIVLKTCRFSHPVNSKGDQRLYVGTLACALLQSRFHCTLGFDNMLPVDLVSNRALWIFDRTDAHATLIARKIPE